jgi:hypothetical protein
MSATMADSVRPARIHPQRLNQIFGCRDQDVYSTVLSGIESLRMTASDAVMASARIPRFDGPRQHARSPARSWRVPSSVDRTVFFLDDRNPTRVRVPSRITPGFSEDSSQSPVVCLGPAEHRVRTDARQARMIAAR